MTDTVIPVTDVNAPIEGVTGTDKTFSSPFIPPLRTKPGQAKPEAVNVAPDAQPEAPPAEVKADAPVEPPKEEAPKDPSVIEYDPNDVFDVVINGKKGEVTLGKLLAAYQKGEAANERFTEAKQAQQAAVQVVRDMTTPQGFVERCRQMQVDPYDLAAEIVLQGADWERMTPDQKELHQLRQSQAKVEQDRKRAEQQQAQQTTEAETRQHQARFLEQMTSSMDRLGMPADSGLRSEIVSRAAGIMRADREMGYETPVSEAVQEAWHDYRGRLTQHAQAIPVEQRLTEAERASLAQKAAQERVRVAQSAPRPQTQPRDDSGKFIPPRKPRFDPYNPMRK